MVLLRAILFLTLLTGATAATGADKQSAPPLGDPDFYPSADRPVGWRGDGSGAFPGATPVTAWNSKTGANIVWKSRMPSPTWGQPIVVGEKVFTTADPNLLLCVSIHDGKILWQKEVDHTTLMPPDKAKKAKEELAYIDSLFPLYVDGFRSLGKLQALAKTKGFKDEGVRNAVMAMGSFESYDLDAPPKGSGRDSRLDLDPAAIKKALADPEIKALFDPLVKLRRDYGFSFTDPRRGDNWTAITGNLPSVEKILARTMFLKEECDIWSWPLQNWYSICTMTFASPTSDGKYVYVAFPNNQVACYDLDGNQKWMIWDRTPKDNVKQIWTRFIPSPLLVDDILVVNQNGAIRAFNKATGAKLWDVKYRKHPKEKGLMAPSVLWSPMHVRLQCEGKPLDLIADGGAYLFRLEDGKIVHEDPEWKDGDWWTSQRAVIGDLLLRRNCARKNVGLYRLRAVSRDKVEAIMVWEKPLKVASFNSPAVYDGKCYDSNVGFDIATGNELPSTRIISDHDYVSPILYGGWLLGGNGGTVVQAGRSDKSIVNVLEDDIETVDPERSRRPYCGQTGRLNYGGGGWNPVVGYSSWYAQANRLFFRSAGYLWCIGDPKQPFQSPSNTPTDAKVGK